MRWKHPFLMMIVPAMLLGVANPIRSQSQNPVSQEPRNSCVSCHLEEEEELAEPVKAMENDIHAKNGLSCADCHGGDPTAGLDGDPDAAMDPAKGYIGVPDRTEIPQFCGRCHSDPEYMRQYNPRLPTDQLDRYKTSIHGKRLAGGDEKVATCVDCHGTHGILKANDSRSPVYATNVPQTCARCHADEEYMADYDIPTDQVEEYEKSVHGQALLKRGDTAAPACNDCHGNHGAAPPAVPSVVYVCGQCHVNNSEMFQESPHKDAFAEEDLPECETCHGNHGIEHPKDEMLGVGPESICLECHDEGEKAYEVAAKMYIDIDSLKTAIFRADSLVKVAETAGMEVVDAKFSISDARQFLIKSRTIIHKLSVEELEKLSKEGMKKAMEAYAMGIAALEELQFRRKGLAISTIFIIILAIGLYFKIREVDKKTQFQVMELGD